MDTPPSSLHCSPNCTPDMCRVYVLGEEVPLEEEFAFILSHSFGWPDTTADKK